MTSARVKLFLGVRISADAVESLGETAESMRRTAYDAGYQIRWVPPVNYHITLSFLGHTQPEIMDMLADRLGPRYLEVPGFDIRCRGLGGFPKLERARVLWAGVEDPTESLQALARVSARELVELGFREDTRPYHPHVTIGRLAQPDDLRAMTSMHSERSFSKTRVESVVLFESVRKSNTLTYVERARWPLG